MIITTFLTPEHSLTVLSGNGLGYFNTVIYANLGVSSVSEQLGYNLLNSVVSAVGAYTAVFLTDRMPRRKVLIFGTLTCAVMLAINAGLSSIIDKQIVGKLPVNKSIAQGALAAYFMFNIIFRYVRSDCIELNRKHADLSSFTYTPLQGMQEPSTFAFFLRHLLTLQPLSPQNPSRTLPVPKVSLLVVSLSALSDLSTLSLVLMLLATLVIDTFSSLSDGMSSNHLCGTSSGT